MNTNTGIEMRSVAGYEGIYSVTADGRIYSEYVHRFLHPSANSHGYFTIILADADGKRKHAYVHRLVAQAFIPNPLGYPEVDHISTEKKDNSVENLRWCNHKQNHHNLISLYLHHHCRTICRVDLEQKEVKMYKTLQDAKKEDGLNKGNLYQRLNAERYPKCSHTYHGYEWYYYDSLPAKYHKGGWR